MLNVNLIELLPSLKLKRFEYAVPIVLPVELKTTYLNKKSVSVLLALISRVKFKFSFKFISLFSKYPLSNLYSFVIPSIRLPWVKSYSFLAVRLKSLLYTFMASSTLPSIQYSGHKEFLLLPYYDLHKERFCLPLLQPYAFFVDIFVGN